MVALYHCDQQRCTRQGQQGSLDLYRGPGLPSCTPTVTQRKGILRRTSSQMFISANNKQFSLLPF